MFEPWRVSTLGFDSPVPKQQKMIPILSEAQYRAMIQELSKSMKRAKADEVTAWIKSSNAQATPANPSAKLISIEGAEERENDWKRRVNRLADMVCDYGNNLYVEGLDDWYSDKLVAAVKGLFDAAATLELLTREEGGKP